MITAFPDVLIKILFVLILGTSLLIIMQKTLFSLISVYGIQSFMIGLISFMLYLKTGSNVLLALAVITLITKVIVIPYMLNRVITESSLKRDADFRYLTPVGAMLAGIILVFGVYVSFSRVFLLSHDNLFFLGAVIGVSLTLIGMLVVFSRKKVVTKTMGYLTMENGILLFSLFMAELPFIIELLIIVDLIIFILLATILAFGIDSTEEDFHRRLDIFKSWFRK